MRKRKNEVYSTSSVEAIEKGDYALMSEVLKLPDFDINARVYGKNTSLGNAVLANKPELVSVFLQMGANPNTPLNNTLTPLQYAVSNNLVGVAKALLEDPRTKDTVSPKARGIESGGTALHIAKAKGHEEIVDLLTAKGAVDIGTGRKAQVQEQFKHISFLAPADIKGELKKAFFEAVETGDIKTLNDLIDNKGVTLTGDASKNYIDSALDVACEKGHLAVVKKLVEVGSNYTNQSSKKNEESPGRGMTALDYAKKNGHSDIVEFLKSTKEAESRIFDAFRAEKENVAVSRK